MLFTRAKETGIILLISPSTIHPCNHSKHKRSTHSFEVNTWGHGAHTDATWLLGVEHLQK